MPRVERRNLQGLIVQSYQSFGYLRSRHLLFALGQAASVRPFLASWLPRVAHAAQDLSAGPDAIANVSFTWTGLSALGALGALGAGAADAFAPEFRAGPEPDITGDAGDSAPERWWNGRFRTEEVHLVLHLHFRTDAAQEEVTQVARASASAAGLRELLPAQDGGALTGRSLSPDPRELHFGYLDGFSQLRVNWDDEPDRPDLVDLRHVLLGYWREDIPSSPRLPPWSDLARDGTYAVLRWLRQDVAGFERFLTENAPRLDPGRPLPEAREFLAAKMMGRWRDGTPLVLSPDRPDPSRAGEDFSYSGDPDGLRCPFAAHIRIANHRDDPLSATNAGMFGPLQPHIVRRGMSYGPRLEGDSDDGIDRGVIGLFLCSSINRQFYPLTRWMRRTDFRDVFRNAALRRQDPIVGNRAYPGADNAFAIPTGAGDMVLGGLPDFVRTQGTLFLFMPGLPALARMAGVD